jgi:hypothetical protein
MPSPWEKYGGTSSKPKPWEKHGGGAVEPVAEQRELGSMSILPFSETPEGGFQFDSNAGLLGAAKRAIMAPREAMEGKFDPLSDEGVKRVNEMAAFATPINPAIRSGSKLVPGVSNTLKKADIEPPTASELIQAGKQGFDAVRDSGVVYKAEPVVNMAAQVQNHLQQKGFHPSHAPTTYKTLEMLQSAPPGATAHISDLIAARRAFQRTTDNFNNPTDKSAAQTVIRAIDDFIKNPGDESVISGPSVSAAKKQFESNANFAAGKRSDTIRGVGETAELRAAAANSGQNLGNAIRSRAATLSDPAHPKRLRGFDLSEKEMIKAIAEGSKTANATRTAGNLLGGGGGLGAMVSGTAAGMVGGVPAAVAVPAIGYGLKQTSNALTRKALNKADDAVRRRSPLFLEMQKQAPAVAEIPRNFEAILRAMMAQQQAQN